MPKNYNLRGIVGKEFTCRDIKRFAKNIIKYINKNNITRSVVIGKDNRVSGDYVLSVVQSILLENGISVYTLGIATTPELVYITKRFNFSVGIMITASHNTWEYNGIKYYDNSGKYFDVKRFENGKMLNANDYQRVVDIENLKEVYIRSLKEKLNANKYKCVFDCANGSTVNVVRNVFTKHIIIGTDMTGKYINDDNGTQCLDNIIAICKRQSKIGFAFDGDGDRVIAIDNDGSVIDGDKILYILATHQLTKGDVVVGTDISSVALEKALDKKGIRLERAKVGAINVVNEMTDKSCVLGAEKCGHIFINSATISDGVLVAIELLNILNRTKMSFKELLKDYEDTYYIEKNIYTDADVKEYIQESENIRVVVRKSETEPLVRIVVESNDRDIASKQMKTILKSLE